MEIDWAAIAAQWIQMRDSSGADISMPAAPPPPNISGHNLEAVVSRSCKRFEEKGEADMDMEDDDECHSSQKFTKINMVPDVADCNVSRGVPVLQQQWFVQPTAPLASTEISLSNQQAQTSSQWNVWPPRMNIPPPNIQAPSANPTAHIPSLMKINVPNPNIVKSVQNNQEEVTSNLNDSTTIDAAKRKILPAWIREGLEKMEREKQRQFEKQQKKDISEPSTYFSDDVVDKSMYSDDLTVKNNVKNILESDSSGNEDAKKDDDNIDGKAEPAPLLTSSKPHSDNDESDVDAERNIGKNYEQRLSDLMIIVRRSLTDMLLEVTNEEISNIAHEAIKSCKSKASSAQVIRKSALSSIAGKLGLAAYDDSSSESNSSETEDNDANIDSEEEIKLIIRQKRRAFAKVAEEIEERSNTAATREEQTLKYHSQLEQKQQQNSQKHQEDENKYKQYKESDRRHNEDQHKDMECRYANSSAKAAGSGKSYERDFGETSETKLQYSNGKRQKERSTQRKERTTRFSDNKDSRAASLAVATTYMSQIQTVVKSSSSTTATATLPALIPTTVTSAIDASGLYQLPKSYSGNGAGIANVLNAAEAALEKVTKRRSTTERHRHSRRRRHSSEDDEYTSDSDLSTSNSSHNSKYSRSSSSKRRGRYRSSRYRKHARRHSRSKTRSRSRSRSSYSSRKHSRH